MEYVWNIGAPQIIYILLTIIGLIIALVAWRDKYNTTVSGGTFVRAVVQTALVYVLLYWGYALLYWGGFFTTLKCA